MLPLARQRSAIFTLATSPAPRMTGCCLPQTTVSFFRVQQAGICLGELRARGFRSRARFSAAACVARPPTNVPVLPYAPVSWPPWAVSDCSRRIRSTVVASAVAAIWRCTVAVPLPNSAVPTPVRIRHRHAAKSCCRKNARPAARYRSWSARCRRRSANPRKGQASGASAAIARSTRSRH